MEWLEEFGEIKCGQLVYTTTCPPTMIAKGCELLKCSLIVSTAVRLSIKFKQMDVVFMQQKSLLEKSLSKTSDVYYHKVTEVADKYRSHYDETAKRCGPLHLQDNAVKKMTNETKNVLTFSATHRIAPAWLQANCTYFLLRSTYWLRNSLMLSKQTFTLSIVLLYHFSMQTDISESNNLNITYNSYPIVIKFICLFSCFFSHVT